ncbi:hypothetical protein [Peribacillus simplex]|uniref:hypothetical protein n=1 Tax=Peribacillus simplex TaxID=1478 RepID=UPI0024C1EB40|nr:hypothetical protein [Peribacillus simplex]WHY56013.1 hypothetical protein QNH43_23215 [Peribacillus simplex]
MPAYFNAGTPLEYRTFDYNAYFDELQKTFGVLSFYKEWKDFWINTFEFHDQKIKDFIKEHPGSNPAREYMNKKNYDNQVYEIYVFEYVTPGGSFHLHFDIEKMKYVTYKKLRSVSVQEIPLHELFVDPTTLYIKDKHMQDERLPFAVEMYGLQNGDDPCHYLCVDGNKRIQSRIKKDPNIQKIESFVFDIDHWDFMFFFSLDEYFMGFTRELQILQYCIRTNRPEREAWESTQSFLQAQYHKE